MISVIVPVYNTARFLPECVDSILGQTYGDLELILVDDGSTDSSGGICDKYARTDDRVCVIHKANGGLSSARNAGLDRAGGELVTFVDSDDMVHECYLERLSEMLASSGAQIAIGGFVYAPVFKKKKISGLSRKTGSLNAIEDTLYQRHLNNSAWGKLYRTELFDGLRFREGIWYEDLDMFYRVYERASTVSVTEDRLYFYRDHAGSFINRFTPWRLDVLSVVDRLEAYMEKHHRELLPAARDRKLSANFNMFLLCMQSGEYERASECWAVIRNYRHGSLIDCKVRMKNKAGIIASFFGKRFLMFLSGWVGK